MNHRKYLKMVKKIKVKPLKSNKKKGMKLAMAQIGKGKCFYQQAKQPGTGQPSLLGEDILSG